jgi:hypothetical protein
MSGGGGEIGRRERETGATNAVSRQERSEEQLSVQCPCIGDVSNIYLSFTLIHYMLMLCIPWDSVRCDDAFHIPIQDLEQAATTLQAAGGPSSMSLMTLTALMDR